MWTRKVGRKVKSRDGKGRDFENRPQQLPSVCRPGPLADHRAGRSRIPFPPRPAFWTSWTTPICASMWRRQRGRRPAGSVCSICLRLESGMGADISMWMSCGWLPPSAAGIGQALACPGGGAGPGMGRFRHPPVRQHGKPRRPKPLCIGGLCTQRDRLLYGKAGVTGSCALRALS